MAFLLFQQSVTMYLTSSLYFSTWRPSPGKPSNGDSDGRASCSGQNLHLKETHTLPQLDWYSHKRYKITHKKT